MRALDGDQVLVRVLIGESVVWHHEPLHLALLQRLRREGFAGATVLRGIAGFGAHSVLHTTHILRLSADLPIVVEIVDAPEKIAAFLPIVDAAIREGLATLERVQIRFYRSGPGS